MKKLKLLSAILSLVLILSFALTACDVVKIDEDTESSTVKTDGETDAPEIKLDRDLEIKISVLNGTTGFGAAKLLADAKEKKTTLNYNISVESDAANIQAGLINGSIDIAALPTNAAAALYNKTNGGVKIAAVNTLGVLYLMTNGTTVTSIADLKGKTLAVQIGTTAAAKAKDIKDEVVFRIGKTQFYRMKNETIGISPLHQRAIKKVFLKYGIEADPVFDRYVPVYPWQ